VNISNSDQKETNGDNIGDACDTAPGGTPTLTPPTLTTPTSIIPIIPTQELPLPIEESLTHDGDYDKDGGTLK